jgi:putative transposase
MQSFEKLIPGKYFHIYNRGINGQNLFLEPANYEHFLRLFEKYVDPVGETFAWCLMPNHFHFLIRIRSFSNPDRVEQPCQG